RSCVVSGSLAFSSCNTSPSAILLVPPAITSITRMLPSDTIISKPREYTKSPTSTLARFVAPHFIGRVAAAAQGRAVDDVVVQQRGCVNEFDDCGRFRLPPVAVAA